jgi:hypothetical protein
MAVPDLKRLALVFSTLRDPDGSTRYRVGTGYFITGNLVLTASHVVPENAQSVEIRAEKGDVAFHAADASPAWRDARLDGALIRVTPGLGEIPVVKWADVSHGGNAGWESTAYPVAAKQQVAAHEQWKSAGLDGTLYGQGGGGQGVRELDLSVNAPPEPTGWGGISGAPVFVGDQLAGIIKEVPDDFRGTRLRGVPSDVLLGDAAFRMAIAPPWLELPSDRSVMVLLSEARRGDLERRVTAAIKRFNEDPLALMTGGPLQPEPVMVMVTEALRSPEQWFQFTKALCKAPVMVTDITGFEPGVMLLLGIRAVVRRGVTIASTADQLDEAHLSQLPFNIQESKVVCHGGAYDPQDPRNPVYVISAAIRDGLRELHSHPRYLDLPVYDAVRCATPEEPASIPSARQPGHDSVHDTVVVLCPFQKEYKDHWLQVSSRIFDEYPNKRVVRILDITSPRLVGQALYEQIRWAETCIVDWTYWRANVFFELGVRLACSEIGPVCLLDEADPEDPTKTNLTHLPDLTQKSRLKELLRPTEYQFATTDDERVAADKALTEAIGAHEAIKSGRPLPVPNTSLSHDATYRLMTDEFDSRQERVNLRPDQLLRSSAESDVGRDPQKPGTSPVLFSSNFGFALQLRRSVQERWIAAWYYLLHRYEREFETDTALREELKALGEGALQAIPRDTDDPLLQRLRNEIVDKIDEFS